EDTRREIGAGAIGMSSIRGPEVDPRLAHQRLGPREPDGGDSGRKLIAELVITLREPRLHRPVRVPARVSPVAAPVAPGHEEHRARAGQRDLALERARVRKAELAALGLGKREELALLLEDDDVPANLVEERLEPLVLHGLPQP